VADHAHYYADDLSYRLGLGIFGGEDQLARNPPKEGLAGHRTIDHLHFCLQQFDWLTLGRDPAFPRAGTCPIASYEQFLTRFRRQCRQLGGLDHPLTWLAHQDFR